MAVAKFSSLKRIAKDTRGVTLIEAAFIFPIIIVAAFAAIEFANYFIRWMVVQRAITAASSYVETVYPNTTSGDAIHINGIVGDIISKTGHGILALNACGIPSATPPTTICGTINVSRYDAGVAADTPYSASLRITTPYTPLTPFMMLVPITLPDKIIVTSSFVVPPAISKPPISTCGVNQFVVYDKDTNTFSCEDVKPTPPNGSCTADQRVTYDAASNTYRCVDMPQPTCSWGNIYGNTVADTYGYCYASGGYWCWGALHNFPIPTCSPDGTITSFTPSTVGLWDDTWCTSDGPDPTVCYIHH